MTKNYQENNTSGGYILAALFVALLVYLAFFIFEQAKIYTTNTSEEISEIRKSRGLE